MLITPIDIVDGLVNRSCWKQGDENTLVISGDFFQAGVTAIICKASDFAGNIAMCTFKVIVNGKYIFNI